MALRVVRLGSARIPQEGIRIGTVRRPPRGVRTSALAAENWYDVWLPNLAPSPQTVKLAQHAATSADWVRFFKTYRREMARPENAHLIALLAALSHDSNFSVGCYCEDERRCHRSALSQLLAEHGAKIEPVRAGAPRRPHLRG